MAKKKDEKEKFERTKPHCNVGTIGHVDHGKTTLTSAITKLLAGIGSTKYRDYFQIDSNPEEKERLITISAAHIEYETEKRHYSHIDCPGHQDYIKNMITGASQLEGVILVVAATDGVQVQTREHVILAREIGIPYMVVFVNKVDMLKETSILELIELEIRELIEMYGFSEDTPFVLGSALKAIEGDKKYEDKILELMNYVDNYIQLPDRKREEAFLMPVENMLVAPGRGTVFTGKVERGFLREGDEVELVGPKILKGVCMGIEMYHRILDIAEAGDNVGILVKGIGSKEIKKSKGYIMAKPSSVKLWSSFKARVYVLSTEEGGRKTGFTDRYKPQFFFRMTNLTGKLTFPDDVELVMPGDNVLLTVNLIDKVVLEKDLRFIIREGKLTVGAGIITELIS